MAPVPAQPISPASLADIICTSGAAFQVKLDAGTITAPVFSPSPAGATATLIDSQTIAVSGLPVGKSYLTFGYVADPGGADANISVGTITTGDAAANPGHIVENDDAAPAIVLYGKAKPW
jgi:hypothetical protein